MSRPVTREQQARSMYGAFLARDFDLIAAELHPDVEYVNPADAVEPGTRTGVEEFVAALRRLYEFFDYEAVEIGDFVEREDQAVAVVRFITKGKESTIRLDLEFGHLLTWQDGKIRRLEWFRTAKDAMDALGASA